ncbi:MAG: hypothetical protein Harvfovirus19_2 [Harvfovirus sp.]|uniref:Uncharacterized protein n=1 Tax=Harvfovirus sp. TaxID=2487768 RepID=A0A3G5A1R3_9VIRU|nr:MAG: hypothetical protein Harvfovirus19_2 [Harvfovirus sp.]
MTVQWKTRDNLLDVSAGSAFRSDVYKAYYNSESFDKKEPYYLNWETQDVHELLNALRDQPVVDRKKLSPGASKLADFLMVDFDNYHQREEEKARMLELEKKEYVALLKSIVAGITADPKRYKCDAFLTRYRWMYSCKNFIPETYSLVKLFKYVDDVPLIYNHSDGRKWVWVRLDGDISGLFMASINMEYWR